VRVKLVNGRTLWVKDVVEDDDQWPRATSSRGRDLLLSRARVKADSGDGDAGHCDELASAGRGRREWRGRLRS
jgi:hypothetical protein